MNYYVGLDIGGTSIKYGLVDETGKILEKDRVKTSISGEEILNNIEMIVSQFKSLKPITAVGVSAPGIVQQDGFMTTGGAIRDFYGINLKKEIEKRTGISTTIENDANAAAFAEQWQGNAVGFHNYYCMVIGTGIGGGLIINDQIYRGGHGMAGELGMMSVMNVSTDTHLEYNSLNFTGATVGGLLRYYNNHSDSPAIDDARVIYQLAAQQDKLALASLDFFYTALAKGIINLMVALDPEIVLIGGGISANSQFMAGLQDKIADLKYRNQDIRNLNFAEVKPAKLRNDAGIIGAVYRAIQVEA
ncbi:ROK family protein [Pediococcus cellicola]|uniref:BglK protein n=1 Tax=Pediococcus cellicola TaxID=319652 RepID=A0A0R2IWW0_9LACO|nr:ROK family protein [Pediococcus cellicola]KRN66196.1 bglK protein [Pediococcus cellicola]GEL15240.1 transcriptional regulator [Pediococcus cellicola]